MIWYDDNVMILYDGNIDDILDDDIWGYTMMIDDDDIWW